MSEYDPPKWNLMESWRYATRGGLVEEEGNPIPRYQEGDAYLLVEKKRYKKDVTYWGTLYPSVTQAVQYARSLGYRGPGSESNMGWKIAYLFDLNTGDIIPTDMAFDQREM